MLAAAACQSDLATGAACVASSQCATNLCYSNLCLLPGADDDGDGLANRDEHRLRSDPRHADSDGDGKPDGSEVGPEVAKPLDSDSDGKPDIVESALADRDSDCLDDERDADDQAVQTDAKTLAKLACAHLGVCAQPAAVITASCSGGELACDYKVVPGWQLGEACDGVDNDCDGQVDEGYVYQGNGIGQPCSGIGACGPGVVVCAVGYATCSTNPNGSQPQSKAEACNGKDDDCDGQTDEGFVLGEAGSGGVAVGAPCLGTGDCGIGKVVCSASGAPICSSDPGGPDSKAKPEACNGRDDDCDGLTDEGLTLQGQPVGQACISPGACGAGKVVCDKKGKTVCSSAVGQSGSPAHDEECNGQDDDCDGLTDENFALNGVALGAACAGKGLCGNGVVACSAQGTVTCSTLADGPQSQAKPELCNGQDDDCDGMTDEKLGWQGLALGAKCDGSGSCGKGSVVCGTLGQATCSTNADGPKGEAKPELCNGLDDDCDGQTDEIAQLPVGFTCETAGVCTALVPVPVCVDAQWQCSFDGQSGYQPAENSCDGLDNDCDGLTDEGLATEWTAVTAWDDGRPLARRGAAWSAGPEPDLAKLWVAGGLEANALGEEVLSPELWRLDAKLGLWTRLLSHHALRRTGAAAVWHQAGGQKIWVVLGGTDPQGNAAPLTAISEDGTAVLAVPPLPEPPTAVTAAVAVVAGNSDVWLLGNTLDGGQAVVQHYQAKAGAWQTAVPQPGLAALAWTGAHTGTAWTVAGLTSAGTAVSAQLVWGGTAWKTLATAPMPTDLTSIGQLTATQTADTLVWLGAARKDGALAPALHNPAGDGAWQPYPAGQPPLRDPLVVASSLGLLVALGADPSGLPQPDTWVRLPAGWTTLDAEPETAVGAKWLHSGGYIVRVGGGVPRGNLLTATAAAWRWSQGAGWQKMATPSPQAGRTLATAILGPDGEQVVLWGGVGSTATAAGTAALMGDGPLVTAPGGLLVEPKLGQGGELPPAMNSQLPVIAADASATPTLDPAIWYIYTLGPSGAAELWRLDWNISKTLVWQSGEGPGPIWKRGTAISYDPLSNRLLVAQVDGALKLWSLQFGPKSDWSLVSTEPGVVQARLVFFGAPGHKDRLLLAVPPPAKGFTQVFRLALGTAALPDLTMQAWDGPPPQWWGAVSGGWVGDGVACDGVLFNDGRYRSRRDRAVRTCPKTK